MLKALTTLPWSHHTFEAAVACIRGIMWVLDSWMTSRSVASPGCFFISLTPLSVSLKWTIHPSCQHRFICASKSLWQMRRREGRKCKCHTTAFCHFLTHISLNWIDACAMSVHTPCISGCLFNASLMSLECPLDVSWMSLECLWMQCLFNVYSVSIQCLSSVYPMSIQCLSNVSWLFAGGVQSAAAANHP